LSGLGAEYDFRDTAREPLSRQELDELIGKRPFTDFINPRSPAYRKMGLAGRKLSRSEAIGLMLEDVNLLRRPLLVKGRKMVFGHDEEAIRSL
jgi:arsenate reductase-like glutaredoxin family protein